MPVAGLDRTVAVINSKGGVYKSSIVSSMGALLAEAGWTVLLVDFDVQGNLAEDLGLADTTDEGQNQLDSIPQRQAFKPAQTGRERLHIVHGGELLHDLVAVMQGRQARDADWMHCLADSLTGVADDYDLILIDCPPGIEVMQTLALVAARYAIIPTRSDSSSRKGLRGVAKRFLAVRPHNPDLELLGVVRTGITKASTGIRDEVAREVAEDLGGAAPVFETCIRYAERPAKSVRDLGRLPHELEPEAQAWYKARFDRMRDKKTAPKPKRGAHRAEPEATVVLAPSTSGLASDYAELAQEFVDLLAKAEGQEATA